MKFKDITVNKDEVIQSLRDVGIEVLDDGDDGGVTLKEIIEARYETLAYKLCDIAEELYARETTSNCIIGNLQGISWNDLCDRGIEILTKLKE